MLQRRKAQKYGLRDGVQFRSQSHLRWIRGFECAVSGTLGIQCCEGRIEAAHVRGETDGGLGVKPSDNWAIPLCSYHHRVQHNLGEHRFQEQYRINMKKVASELWAKSPHRPK